MESCCTIAANRFLKREKTNAFHRHDGLRSYYESFPEKGKISFSAFKKHMSRKFKKPRRESDMCEKCVQGKYFFKCLRDSADKIELKKFNIQNVDSKLDDLEEFLKHLKSQEEKEGQNELRQACGPIYNYVELVKEVQFHRCIAHMQNKMYNTMKKDPNLLSNSLLIDLDFKQKIVIGDAPCMLSGEYFERKQRSMLGFGVYYFDVIANCVKCIHFDFISDVDCKQDAAKAVVGFKFLRETAQFKAIEKDNYIIWSDCGGHFRCAEFISYLFDDLRLKKKIKIQMNFFAENHGKNSRDQHFSVVSNYVRLESFKVKITSTQQLVDVLNRRQHESNSSRGDDGLEEIESYAFVLRHVPEQVNSRRIIKNLKMYYNFSSYIRNGSINLTTNTFSSNFTQTQNTIDVKSNYVHQKNSIQEQVESEESGEDENEYGEENDENSQAEANTSKKKNKCVFNYKFK